MKYLEHKGYTGTIEYSSEDSLLFGQVMGLRSLISYEGSTGKELELDFKSAIDEYLADCKEQSIKPEKPFKGSFNVRVTSELHREAVLFALKEKMSLNSFVAESIKSRLVVRTAEDWKVSKKQSKAPASKKGTTKSIAK